MAELRPRIDHTVGDPADAVNLEGTLLHTWRTETLNSPTDFPIGNQEMVVQEVRAIREAYNNAATHTAVLSTDINELINEQLRRFDLAFEYVKVNSENYQEAGGVF